MYDEDEVTREDSDPARVQAARKLPAVTQFDSPDKTIRIRIDRLSQRETPSVGSLLVVGGSPPDIGRHHTVDAQVVIGRATEDGLSLRDGNVSRRHAQVERHGHDFYVSDMGSTNGSRLNGKRVAKATKLKDGDTILVGQTVIKFHVVDDAARGLTKPPWLVLVMDPDQQIQPLVREATYQGEYCGRPVEVVGTTSVSQAFATAEGCDESRLAVAFIDVSGDRKPPGLALASKLRSKLGNAIQLILYSENSEDRSHDGGYFLPRADFEPGKIRAQLDLSIRNFRSLVTMSVLCNTLSRFAALFESANDPLALNQLLAKALHKYATFWRFDYHLISDLTVDEDNDSLAEWQVDVRRQLHDLERQVYRSVEFSRLQSDLHEIWACVIKPIGGTFTAGFAIRVQQTPPAYLLEDLQAVLRGWALARTSLQIRQIINDEQSIRTEMDKERREGIAKMVAAVAHEVNTPLGIAKTAAATMSQILARMEVQATRGPTPSESNPDLDDEPDRRSEYDDLQLSARLIVRSITRAGELIQDFKRLSVGQLVDVLEEIDVVKAVQNIVDLHSSQSTAGLEVMIHDHTEPGCTTWIGYFGYLSQIVMNLLSNTERYGYPEGQRSKLQQERPHRGMTVDITVSSRLVGDVPEFALTFTDYGVGIAGHRVPLIFDPFYTTGRDKGASGLGLSVVYNIVTNIFNGSVRCQAMEGHGTTFFVTFKHCELERNIHASIKGLGQVNVEVFRDFITLQRQLIQAGALSPDEQVRLTEAAAVVDRYVEVRFKDHHNRKSPRIPTRRIVEVRCGDGHWERSELRDISQGGAMHVLRHEVPQGTPIWMRYWPDRNFVIEGEVVESINIRSLDNQESEWQTGIKFTNLTDVCRRNLKLLIAEVMLEYWG